MSRRISSPVFVGRNAELAQLVTAYDRAAAGEPGMVLVAGEAGIGKSRLVAELAVAVSGRGGVVLSGGCLDLGDGGQPYAPVAEALRTYVRGLEGEARSSAFGPGSVTLASLVPDLARSPALGASTPLVDDAPLRQARMFDAVAGALEHLATQRPVTLILEDLHWADGSTRDLVRFLARNLGSVRLLLVATYRADELHRRHPVLPLLGELERSNRTETVELARLTHDELSALLEGIVGEPPDPTRIYELHARSNGIPFYVEELLAAPGEGRMLPITLRGILSARLGGLSANATSVVRAAAVVGGVVPHDRLVAAIDMTHVDLIAALGEVVESRILTSTDGLDGPAYEFRHALLREAALDDLLPAERVRLHARLADDLDARIRLEDPISPSLAADAAIHAYSAHDLPRALGHAVRAIHALVGAAAQREALDHAERALELWPRVPDAAERAGMTHASLLLLASRIAAYSSQPERALAFGRGSLAAFEAAGDVSGQVEVLAELHLLEWETDAFEDSSASVQRALELVSDAAPSRLKAIVLFSAGGNRWWNGDLTDAVGLFERAIEMAESVGDPAVYCDAVAALAHTRADLGEAVRGADLADVAGSSSGFEGRPLSLWNRTTDRSLAYLTVGRFEDAVATALTGVELARRFGWAARMAGELAGCAAEAQLELGRYDEAAALIHPYLGSHVMPNARQWAHQTSARIAVARDRLDDARRHLEGATPFGARGSDVFYHEQVVIELARADGRFEDVAHAVQRCLDQAAIQPSVAGLWTTLGTAIGAAADQAVLDRTRRRVHGAERAAGLAASWLAALQAIAERCRAGGGAGPWFEAVLETAQADAERAHGSRDVRAWQTVASSWRALSQPRQLAYAGLHLAEAILGSGGGRADAAAAAVDAMDTAMRIGAERLVRDIERLAEHARLDIGAPSAPAAAPAAAEPGVVLTSRERDVLRLVAAGHTNREIGANLFISEKTVSVHVSNAMAKLDSLSRYEAAAAAERLGLL